MKALAIPDEDYRRAFSDEQRRRWDALKEALEAAVDVAAVLEREPPLRPLGSPATNLEMTGRSRAHRLLGELAGMITAKTACMKKFRDLCLSQRRVKAIF